MTVGLIHETVNTVRVMLEIRLQTMFVSVSAQNDSAITEKGLHASPESCSVWLVTDRPRHLGMERRPLPSFILVSFRRPVSCCSGAGIMEADQCRAVLGPVSWRPTSVVLFWGRYHGGRPVSCCSGAGIMEADNRQVTTVFTVQPSFHHRHSTNRAS